MKDLACFDPADCDLAAFAALTGQRLDPGTVPRAAEVVRNVPVYDAAALGAAHAEPAARRALAAVWAPDAFAAAPAEQSARRRP